ncbi:Unknown protein, partial [Striga hermonthica]
AEIHLAARGLGKTIISPNDSSIQDRTKAMIFLRHHLNDGLKNEYLTVKDPADLWKALKERYDHQKTVILPRARYEWMHLRFQDFKTVNEYYSAMFCIFSVLKLCGETITDYDMLEKMLSTFHASNVLLQQQYRAKDFAKYYELVSCLLLAEQNNELLMINHEYRPTVSSAIPEINIVISRQGNKNENSQTYVRGYTSGRRHGRGCGYGPDRRSGRGHRFYRGYNSGREYNRGQCRNDAQNYERGRNFQPKFEQNNVTKKFTKDTDEKACYRCGRKGHWTRNCRAPKHVTYAATNSQSIEMFKLWHDRLDHPGWIMMSRIIESSDGHPLKNQRIFQSHELSYASCSQGKLIVNTSHTKVENESPLFLERIPGDICGPIHPPCGPFRYFMALIDASSRWSHVSLLSTRNVAFAKLLAQLIKLKAQFPDHIIKKVRLDDVGEFTSQAFNDYCMVVGIDIEHHVAHVHTQNGLAESLIKRLQLIARPLIIRTKLPTSVWGHAILHAGNLIQIRPSAYHKYSPLQLAFGIEPNLEHIRIFGCAVYVPIAPPQRTKMGPQRRLRIYVGYESPSIIKYLEPKTGDVFTARFDD